MGSPNWPCSAPARPLTRQQKKRVVLMQFVFFDAGLFASNLSNPDQGMIKADPRGRRTGSCAQTPLCTGCRRSHRHSEGGRQNGAITGKETAVAYTGNDNFAQDYEDGLVQLADRAEALRQFAVAMTVQPGAAGALVLATALADLRIAVRTIAQAQEVSEAVCIQLGTMSDRLGRIAVLLGRELSAGRVGAIGRLPLIDFGIVQQGRRAAVTLH